MALNLDTLGLSATVTAQGISAPDYQTILDTLTSYFRQIYGSDAYLEPDSKDGQMVALVALAVHDANNTAIGIYNSFSPTTAQAAALSSNVKINGITRKVATNSTADLLLTGTAGTTITNGSPVAATVGSPAETDAELRIRQGQSVALSSITPFEGVDGAIANVAGVTRHKLYENDTGATDSNGLPPHSISAIVEGGDVTEIAQTIRGNKGQGTATYGTTSVTVPDTYGNPHVISFSRSTDVPIFVAITLKVFTGYTSQIGEQIKQAVADYINGLAIGDDVLLSRIYSPANLGVVSGGSARYYDIQELLIGKSSDSVASGNIDIAYDESASCVASHVTITVTS